MRVVFSKNAESYDVPLKTVDPKEIQNTLASDLLILDISRIDNIRILEDSIRKISRTKAKVLVCNNRNKVLTNNIAKLIENYSKIRKIYIGCKTPKVLFLENISIKNQTDPVKIFYLLNLSGKVTQHFFRYREKAIVETVRELTESNSRINTYLLVPRVHQEECTEQIRDELKSKKELEDEKTVKLSQFTKMSMPKFRELRRNYKEKKFQLYINKDIKVIGSIIKKGTIIENSNILRFTTERLILDLAGQGVHISLRKHASKLSLLKSGNISLCKNERIRIDRTPYVVKKIEGQSIVCLQGERYRTVDASNLSAMPEYDYVKTVNDIKYGRDDNVKLILAMDKLESAVLPKLVKNSTEVKIFTSNKSIFQWRLSGKSGIGNNPFLGRKYKYKKYYPFITKSYIESIERMNRRMPQLPESVFNEYAIQEAESAFSRIEIAQKNQTNIKTNQGEVKNNGHIIRSV